MAVNKGGRPSLQRDRLNAYVEPDTTEIIEKVKEKLFEETGLRITIGMAVDYIAKYYERESEK